MKKRIIGLCAALILLCLGSGCAGGESGQSGGVDLDLTQLSSTVMYGELFSIMTEPEEYVGKTIKISGQYYVTYYDEGERYFHAVMIEDATACCQQGMEFMWEGEHAYPEDYPEDGVDIEISGVFGSYEELGYSYYYLSVEEIKVL